MRSDRRSMVAAAAVAGGNRQPSARFGLEKAGGLFRFGMGWPMGLRVRLIPVYGPPSRRHGPWERERPREKKKLEEDGSTVGSGFSHHRRPSHCRAVPSSCHDGNPQRRRIRCRAAEYWARVALAGAFVFLAWVTPKSPPQELERSSRARGS